MKLDLTRRTALRGAVGLTAAAMAPQTVLAAAALPPQLKKTEARQIALPFAENALDPVISEKTIGFHYGKHHKAYADKVAEMIKGTALESASLEDIIVSAAADPKETALANAAGQLWNHNFYWQSLTPSPQEPSGKLAAAIASSFGTQEACVAALTKACTGQFGSGWGWLVLESGAIKAISTSNADTPLLHGQVPLLTVDVWEHAYYLDYQNRRSDHVAAVLAKTINWDFAAQNFGSA